jgi:PIN domain-containing protein
VKWEPFATRLRLELDALAKLGDQLLGASTIEDQRLRNRGGSFVFIAPDWAWGPPSDELRRLQIALVPRFDRWLQRCELIFATAPEELREKLGDKTSRMREWIARDDRIGGWGAGWDIPPTILEAKAKLRSWGSEVRALIEIVAPQTSDQRVIAVPDTSALVDAPDLGRYGSALGVNEVDVFVIAPVLTELDALKDQGKNPEIRAKARTAIGAVKALRDRGSLLTGVDLGNDVRVFSRPQEPKFDGLPGALDPSVPDDRILAAAFELQRDHSTAAVVLVTGDVNLQTKAELAELPFVEPPAP